MTYLLLKSRQTTHPQDLTSSSTDRVILDSPVSSILVFTTLAANAGQAQWRKFVRWYCCDDLQGQDKQAMLLITVTAGLAAVLVVWRRFLVVYIISHVYSCVCVYVCKCVYVCLCACVRVCVCVCLSKCIHIHAECMCAEKYVQNNQKCFIFVNLCVACTPIAESFQSLWSFRHNIFVSLL